MKRKRIKSKTLKKIFILLLSIVTILIIALGSFGYIIFHDVKKTVDGTYESVKRQLETEKIVELSQKEPFTVLFLGVDTGALGRTEQGRSDTIMLATVNPIKKKTLLLSLSRDTYAEIIGHNSQDKINHAYAFGGAAMAMDTVQGLLDVPIDYYITINMQGIETLVDTVGGITVNNPFEFTYEKTTFPEGKQPLNGKRALKYSRMRYDDPKGDYGRQQRQQQIVQGIADQMLQPQNIINYRKILTALGENVQTNLTSDNIKILFQSYRPALGMIQKDQLKGEGFMQDGVSYQRINEKEMERVKAELRQYLT